MNHTTLIDIDKNIYHRISKQRAIARQIAGGNVYILPCLARTPSLMYSAPQCIPNELRTLNTIAAFINAYTWSNCNDELGYYIAYYIKEGE